MAHSSYSIKVGLLNELNFFFQNHPDCDRNEAKKKSQFFFTQVYWGIIYIQWNSPTLLMSSIYRHVTTATINKFTSA